MKTHFRNTLLAGACVIGSALAAPKAWDGTYTRFVCHYLIYSNDLDEKSPPTATDRRASFEVEGTLAKSLFDSIGPDQKDTCGASPDLRIRQRGDLDCTFDKLDKANPYTCHFGLDMRTGKSIGGSTC
ncbi:MAG TPA: hypothetical protein VFF16_01165 [Telluria sp.]|nr:hypothetical protein [Telluria sp.]